MNRIFELTDLKTCEKSFNLDDLLSAKEAMMVGTTLDVLSVISIDGKKVGSGKPGPIAQALRKMILLDQISR
jgi:branched-subunit amino acid aminotransferase/4-amino-4-deoxychorismate lyase